MLTVYTRHLKGCDHRSDSHWRRCHCPKWIRGLLLTSEKIRRTAETSNWENAEKLARQLDADFDPKKPFEPKTAETPLPEAVEVFLADQTARGLPKESKKKYGALLERQFLTSDECRLAKADALLLRLTANLETCCSNYLLSHLGQAPCEPNTMLSKRWRQLQQIYSDNRHEDPASVRIELTPYYKCPRISTHRV